MPSHPSERVPSVSEREALAERRLCCGSGCGYDEALLAEYRAALETSERESETQRREVEALLGRVDEIAVDYSEGRIEAVVALPLLVQEVRDALSPSTSHEEAA